MPRSLQVRLNTSAFDRLMVSHGFNVSTLAKELGVSRTTISNARNGKTMPRASVLARICEVLECDRAEILREV